MSTTPSLEDAIKAIAAKCRKERIRGTLIVLVIGLIFASLLAGGGILIARENFAQHGSYFVPIKRFLGIVGVALIFGTFGCLLVRGLKTQERDKLQRLQSLNNELFKEHRACVLLEHGYHELALETFDYLVEKIFEETPKREEELNRFFDEFHTKTRFVDGIPRPVPAFRDHDPWALQYLISRRMECLTKLGRDKEVEAAAAQLEAIRKIQDEGRELTKKYWEDKYID